jgi:DNA-binding MarR family transcriptional regulator
MTQIYCRSDGSVRNRAPYNLEMADDPRASPGAVGRAHVLTGFGAAAVDFVRALEANRERIALDEGLTGSELRALFHIGKVVSITPKELADHFGMTTGGITFISRRLVDRGLLHRVDHPNDRRSVYLELTPLAHSKLDTIHREFESMIDESTRFLPPTEVDRVAQVLAEVAVEVTVRTVASAPRAHDIS